MGNYLQPPAPHTAAVVDRKTGKSMDFSPQMYRWLLELVQIINKSGGVEGSISSDRTISTVEPIVGGGDLSADRTFSLDINGLTADAAPDGAADYVVTYDASAGANKKVLLDDISGGGGLSVRSLEMSFFLGR